MHVFVTGATGFIGTEVVQELIKSGHQVTGLARTDVGAQSLIAAGAKVHQGSLEDLDSLRHGAEEAEGVIHLAFIHDFSKFVANCETDRRVIETLGSVLVGTNRPLIITSGTGIANTVPGQPAKENNVTISSSVMPRAASEEAAAALVASGVNVSIVRLPQVHNPIKQGLITYTMQLAKAKGVSAYVGDGLNHWPAAHLSDTALLYRLALEKGEKGAKYHAVAEEGIPLRDIASVIGRGLKIPVVSLSNEEAAKHFGWLAMFVGRDVPASSELTRNRLNWNPTGPGLIEDLECMDYSRVS